MLRGVRGWVIFWKCTPQGVPLSQPWSSKAPLDLGGRGHGEWVRVMRGRLGSQLWSKQMSPSVHSCSNVMRGHRGKRIPSYPSSSRALGVQEGLGDRGQSGDLPEECSMITQGGALEEPKEGCPTSRRSPQGAGQPAGLTWTRNRVHVLRLFSFSRSHGRLPIGCGLPAPLHNELRPPVTPATRVPASPPSPRWSPGLAASSRGSKPSDPGAREGQAWAGLQRPIDGKSRGGVSN